MKTNNNYTLRLNSDLKEKLEEKAASQGRTLPQMMKDQKLRLADLIPIIAGPVRLYFLPDHGSEQRYEFIDHVPFALRRFSVECINTSTKDDAVRIYLGRDWKEEP